MSPTVPHSRSARCWPAGRSTTAGSVRTTRWPRRRCARRGSPTRTRTPRSCRPQSPRRAAGAPTSSTAWTPRWARRWRCSPSACASAREPTGWATRSCSTASSRSPPSAPSSLASPHPGPPRDPGDLCGGPPLKCHGAARRDDLDSRGRGELGAARRETLGRVVQEAGVPPRGADRQVRAPWIGTATAGRSAAARRPPRRGPCGPGPSEGPQPQRQEGEIQRGEVDHLRNGSVSPAK